MRRAAVLFAVPLLMMPAMPALADDVPSVDLVAAFLLGIEDGSSLRNGGGDQATIARTGPGTFEGTPTSGPGFIFHVAEKASCVFDLTFEQSGQNQGGIELDTTRLTSVSYDKTADNSGITDYVITLDGQDGVIQYLTPDGTLSEAPKNSQMSTSLTAEHMLEQLAALQAGPCPAA